MLNKVYKFMFVKTLLGDPRGPVELGNPNTCAEVKLCLFLFTSALEIICRETEILNTVSYSSVRADSLQKFSLKVERNHSF